MVRHKKLTALYAGRRLSQGYPDLESRGVAFHAHSHEAGTLYTPAFMECLGNLIDLTHGPKTVLVVGCGPKPRAVKWLLEAGYDALGIEAVEGLLHSAQEFLGDSRRVRLGTAEAMPVEDSSQRVILMESLLEHVESPQKTLAEAFRTLMPGGVLYVYTTNKWKFKLSGFNGEFQVPFFNWFPETVKESYVFQHLHYDPQRANFNPRPAVHWFSYSDLCKLGRQAGFAHFYSLLDLADLNNPIIAHSRMRRFLLNRVRYNPWLRSLALTQMGGSSIFMLKRPSP